MANASCLLSSLNVKKKNAILICGLDLQCRKVCWIAVEHKMDLPHPAKPFSHRKDLEFSSLAVKAGSLTSQSPVRGVLLFAGIMKMEGIIGSYQPVPNTKETWETLTRLRCALTPSTSSWIRLMAYCCKNWRTSERWSMLSTISSFSFSSVLFWKGYATHRAVVLIVDRCFSIWGSFWTFQPHPGALEHISCTVRR